MMTLTDFRDPFAATSPLSERRSSTHSDRSLSKRLMQKIDGKTTKTSIRVSTADSAKKKESRDRSSTLPSRGRYVSELNHESFHVPDLLVCRTPKDATEGYQALRAVEPPWATSPSPSTPSTSSPRAAAHDRATPPKASPHGTITVRQPKSSKPGLPWSQTQGTTEQALLQAHKRVPSSSSTSHERPIVSGPTHASRPSTSSSIPTTSPTSSMFTSHYSTNSISSGLGSEQLVDVRYGTVTLQVPMSPSVPRTNPRPPPTTSLPPTPVNSSRPSSTSSPSHLSTEQHPLRSRSSTVASTSAVSFASSLSSLSFNSRPSPQEPPSVGAYDYPSLLNETLPVPGADEAILRRGSHSGSSSGSHKDSKDDHIPATDHTPRQTKGVLAPASRPLPSPPITLQGISILPKRERVLSTSSSITSEAGHPALLRKQRSFHNLSLHAPTPLKPTLRHYYSFEPASGQQQPGSASGELSSPPLPPLHSPLLFPVRSPPLPPTQDLPPLPSSASSSTGGKRGSIGKDSIASPRRKLFGTSKHDRERERERKQGLNNIDTISSVTHVPGIDSAGSSSQMQTSLSSSSSSWFDDRVSEPASASSTSPSAAHDVAQHIVPPAELLRLGATWERESEGRTRRAKSSWGSDGSRTSTAASSKGSLSRSTTGASNYGASPSSAPLVASPSSPGSKLPRSASLLSNSSSTPSFRSRTHNDTTTPPPHTCTPFPTGSSSGSNSKAHRGVPTGTLFILPPPPEPEADLYTSLSPPPPRRAPCSLARAATTQHVSSGLPPPPRRRTATASGALLASSPPSSASAAIALTSGSPPPTKGALIERKPSFLDMTSTRQSVTLDVPDLDGHDEPERDSFLELSRGMTSIETIRESTSSVDSFMQ